MSKKKLLMLLAVMMILALVLGLAAGCGGDSEEDPGADPGEDQSEDNERADWPASVRLGTAGPGGVYEIYGSGWGNMVSEILDISFEIQATGGPADNMTLVQDGALDLGMITMGIGYEAWNGLEGTNFENDPHTNVRALFPMYNTYSQWWAHKDSGITSLNDLEGKKVGVGPTGGTPGTYHPLILEAIGIDAECSWAATADLSDSHKDGLLDANSFASGIPLASVLDYAASVGPENVVFFGVDGENREKVMEAYPYWTPATIPAATYEFTDSDVETIGMFNWAIVHKDMPDTLVYQIVDTVMNNNERMLEVHSAAAETLPEFISTNSFLPLHPGAYQWFVDNGYTVADGAKPID